MSILENIRQTTRRQILIDVAVFLAALVFGCAQLALTSSTIFVRDEGFRSLTGVINVVPTAQAYMLVAASIVPLLVRRHVPYVAFGASILAYMFAQGQLNGFSVSIIGPAIALFTIAHTRPVMAVVASACVTIVALFVVAMPLSNAVIEILARLQNVSFAGIGIAGGIALKAYEGYVRAAQERADEAWKTREEEAARRVEAERVRIARELHDITAHSLSAVNIQARGAASVIDKNPAAAKEALERIQTISKDSLDEIRAMIGVLRNEGSEAEYIPTLGTERMSDLMTFAEEAGITLHLDETSYHKTQVPAYVDVALFGIAREALTNVIKHAHAQNVWIHLANSAGLATLKVKDDGVGLSHDPADARTRKNTAVPQASAPGDATQGASFSPGHGIQGMRERVQALSGEFDCGAAHDGGFFVHVALPYDAKISE